MNNQPLNYNLNPVGPNADKEPPSYASWLTKDQVAAHFQVGLRTVSSLMKRRVLPYTKVRHLVRFNVADCDAAFGFFKRGHRCPAPSQPPKWVTKLQVATHINVSPRTVTNLMRQQSLPYVKIGRLVRFDLHACDERMRLCRTPAVSERGSTSSRADGW